MAFGFLKNLVGKVAKAITGTPVATLDYRGRDGTEEAPFRDYSQNMEGVRKKGVQEVRIVYGDNSGNGYPTLRKVNDSTYVDRISQVESQGRRVLSVDDQGLVRRLKTSEYAPAGVNKSGALCAYKVSETIEAGEGRKFRVYDTREKDEFGHRISYVIDEANSRKAQIEDKSEALLKYQNRIVDSGSEFRGMNEVIGRGYLESKLKELEAVSQLRTVVLDGVEYYAENLSNGKVRTFKKSLVDNSLWITQYTLDNNDEDKSLATKYSERQLRNAFAKRNEKKDVRKEEKRRGSFAFAGP